MFPLTPHEQTDLDEDGLPPVIEAPHEDESQSLESTSLETFSDEQRIRILNVGTDAHDKVGQDILDHSSGAVAVLLTVLTADQVIKAMTHAFRSTAGQNSDNKIIYHSAERVNRLALLARLVPHLMHTTSCASDLMFLAQYRNSDDIKFIADKLDAHPHQSIDPHDLRIKDVKYLDAIYFSGPAIKPNKDPRTYDIDRTDMTLKDKWTLCFSKIYDYTRASGHLIERNYSKEQVIKLLHDTADGTIKEALHYIVRLHNMRNSRFDDHFTHETLIDLAIVLSHYSNSTDLPEGVSRKGNAIVNDNKTITGRADLWEAVKTSLKKKFMQTNYNSAEIVSNLSDIGKIIMMAFECKKADTVNAAVIASVVPDNAADSSPLSPAHFLSTTDNTADSGLLPPIHPPSHQLEMSPAYRAIEDSITHEPENILHYQKLAALQHADGKFDEAIDTLVSRARCNFDNPQHSGLRNQIAELYLERSNQYDAQGFYTEARNDVEASLPFLTPDKIANATKTMQLLDKKRYFQLQRQIEEAQKEQQAIKARNPRLNFNPITTTTTSHTSAHPRIPSWRAHVASGPANMQLS